MSDSSSPKVFLCPGCGASLQVVDAPSVVCTYCGSHVIVPAEFRPPRPQVTFIQVESKPPIEVSLSRQPRPASAVRATCVIFMAGLLLITSLIAVLVINQSSHSVTRIVEGVATSVSVEILIPTPLPADTAAPTPISLASPVLEFGSQGGGAGQLDDPRHIAVDDEGNVYVADYTDGRVQKFDSTGQFQLLIQVEPARGDDDVYIMGMAVDNAAHLYIIRAGDILQYDTADGSLLATISNRWPEINFDELTVDTQGMLYATNGMAAADDIIKLDPQGKILAHWQEVIESVDDDDPAMSMKLAVNTEGTIYLLSQEGRQVYTYDAQGKFLFRFGGQKKDAASLAYDTPGKFSAFPDGLALDSRGNIYVINFYRVDQYTSQGEYTGNSLLVDYSLANGALRDIAIDAENDLYIITSGGKVLEYRLSQAGR